MFALSHNNDVTGCVELFFRWRYEPAAQPFEDIRNFTNADNAAYYTNSMRQSFFVFNTEKLLNLLSFSVDQGTATYRTGPQRKHHYERCRVFHNWCCLPEGGFRSLGEIVQYFNMPEMQGHFAGLIPPVSDANYDKAQYLFSNMNLIARQVYADRHKKTA